MRRACGILAILGSLAGAGCESSGAEFDSRPIQLVAAPTGGLLALGSADGFGTGDPFPTLIDTGSAITVFSGPRDNDTRRRTFRLHESSAGMPAPVRAEFRHFDTFTAPLGPSGSDAESLMPLAVLGGDILTRFGVEFSFPDRTLTLWGRVPATTNFLAAAGFAVFDFTLHGGGTASGCGRKGPIDRLLDHVIDQCPSVEIPPTRLVLRACGAPVDFKPDDAPARCCAPDLQSTGSGADLSLLLATGVGPVVLSRSAFDRVALRAPDVRAPQPGPALLLPLWVDEAGVPTPLAAAWTTLPRLALVDREANGAADPGPCVELARARRLEQVARRQATTPDLGTCAEPCDRTRNSAAAPSHASAAYADIGGPIPVAVVDDDSVVLQALREEIRPEGPEIDGLLGAAALNPLRVEIDYPGDGRMIVSCDPAPCVNGPDAPDRDLCWSAARCPGIAPGDKARPCFCLPPHAAPAACSTGLACE